MSAELSHPDDLYLRAAQGWLELGNPAEAHEELNRLSPQARPLPDILEFRWHVSARARDWARCLEFAESLLAAEPTRASAWIHRSFALHELKRSEEAFERLAPAVARFPEIWTIPYNLACYCAQLGRLDEALTWYRNAKLKDAHAVTEAGKEDPDLQPLWKYLDASGTSVDR